MISDSHEWLGGKLYSWDSSSIPAGFRLGDGVFETIRTYNGVPFKLTSHISRLLSGARSIGMKELPTIESVKELIMDTLKSSISETPQTERIIRPLLFSDHPLWGFVVLVDPIEAQEKGSSEEGLTVGISSHSHPERYLIPPSGDNQVKWISRGPLSQALRDATSMGWDEALLTNSKGRIVEGTRSNILVISDNRIIAPGTKSFAFPGITRSIVVESAKTRGVEVIDRPLELVELLEAQEALLTSTLLGVMPILHAIYGNRIQRLKSGELSKILISDFKAETQKQKRF
ncbi:MAG: aminotransferase class IV [Thermoplasmataceae archaeon]